MQARQLAYLQALGIDVWVRRGAAESERTARRPGTEPRAALAAPDAAHSPEQRETARQRNAATPARAGAAAPKEPSAALPHDAEVPAPRGTAAPVRFVIQCFKLGQTLALIDEPLMRHRRLLLDIARALDASGASERQDITFEWPQLNFGDASMAAAGAAFRAFLAAQTTAQTHWLAVGSRVETLIGDAPRDAHVFLPDALESLDKRALWQEIRAKR